MRILNALINLGLRSVAVTFALFAIPPAFLACILLFAASTFNLLSDERPENP